jgi:alpha-ribazole phosphatase
VQLFERVTRCYDRIAAAQKPAVVVAHGGVIRSILAYLTNTSLKESFAAFKPHYGCVIKVDENEYEILSNIATEREQHKPSAR